MLRMSGLMWRRGLGDEVEGAELERPEHVVALRRGPR